MEIRDQAAPKAIRSRKALVAFNADLERAAKEMREEDAEDMLEENTAVRNLVARMLKADHPSQASD